VAAPDLRCYKPSMNEFEGVEERVFYKERFQGSRLDFRGRTWFQRYDCCEFVKAIILTARRRSSIRSRSRYGKSSRIPTSR
jgi:hypothetical protein